jgi:Undecaprenyl-phosphate galactose phosphotransferase WbaP
METMVKYKTIKDIISGEPTPRQGTSKKRLNNIRLQRSRRYMAQIFLTSTPLIVADLLASIGSCLIAIISQKGLNLGVELELIHLLPFLAMIFLFVYLMFGLYPGSGLSPIFELRQVTVATTLIFMGFFAVSLPLSGIIPLSMVVIAWIILIITAPIMRFIFRRIFAHFSWWGQPVLIFGGQKAGTSFKYLSSRPYFGLRPVGIVGETKSYPYLGTIEMAPAIARENLIFWAVVALPERSASEVLRVMKTYLRHFPHVLFLRHLEGLPSLWNRSFDFGQLHGIWMQSNLLLPLPRFIKRLVDLGLALFLGFLCLPLIGLIAALIKSSSPGPVFYSQERIGFQGHRFKAWKFRTMYTDANDMLKQLLASDPELREEWEANQKLKNDPRVTKIGRWLRKTSLDELPQLWNILVGEMSTVGPRPIVEGEIERYGESYSLYKRVVPGLTGLWQVSGRNNTTYGERVSLDSYYVWNWSPWMDIYILARTIKVVLFFKGAY